MSTMAWDVQPRFGAEVRTMRPVRPLTASPSAVGDSGRAASGLRLTRRGRLTVVLLALGLALVAGLSAESAMADGPGEALQVVTHTVAAGETLWEVAGSVAGPGQDRRDVVDELIDLNGLADSGLQAGQQILVPVG
ncbi:LysM peptidoglycan-binding domain-containing protein [Cellulomonas sp. KRMCY2]|uniref:LysM peptidoglycan-binding domain-containing protein n=1 Tax=Cellulomonas sp. KRMCY2 TaxID=1304865 RepID=UPI00045EA434|nr:LysM peptidoglycan-binding domain-containing protein [Cellulomonas sp. KRMCY2]